ncbi:hypothetical protein V498_04323 [Pseudogymnoascus sp. VKM F-4517 (FW-2822)]|nr:hypothetical protein V498_04323 [Pseudogymnoascus sp. VKM F-4517 (FW-2822)]
MNTRHSTCVWLLRSTSTNQDPTSSLNLHDHWNENKIDDEGSPTSNAATYKASLRRATQQHSNTAQGDFAEMCHMPWRTDSWNKQCPVSKTEIAKVQAAYDSRQQYITSHHGQLPESTTCQLKTEPQWKHRRSPDPRS